MINLGSFLLPRSSPVVLSCGIWPARCTWLLLASLNRALCVARRFVEIAPREQRLRLWVGTAMLRAGIVAYANAAASYHGADVIGLLRDILIQQLDSQPGPAQARDMVWPPVRLQPAFATACWRQHALSARPCQRGLLCTKRSLMHGHSFATAAVSC